MCLTKTDAVQKNELAIVWECQVVVDLHFEILLDSPKLPHRSLLTFSPHYWHRRWRCRSRRRWRPWPAKTTETETRRVSMAGWAKGKEKGEDDSVALGLHCYFLFNMIKNWVVVKKSGLYLWISSVALQTDWLQNWSQNNAEKQLEIFTRVCLGRLGSDPAPSSIGRNHGIMTFYILDQWNTTRVRVSDRISELWCQHLTLPYTE